MSSGVLRLLTDPRPDGNESTEWWWGLSLTTRTQRTSIA